MKKQNIYESPYVTADTVIFTIDEGGLKILLAKRKYSPFTNWWALPGVFLLKKESTEAAARRGLKEKTGIKVSYLEQLYTFDSPFRDPRGHVISITYFALAPKSLINLNNRGDTQTPTLFPINKLPKLAFDHKKIINYALSRLRSKLEYTNVVYSLLPAHFTLTELQDAYEAIFGKKLDKRNFRKKFLSLNLIRPTKRILQGAKARPAHLFEFKSKKPSELKKFF